MKVRFAVSPPVPPGDVTGFAAIVSRIEALGFDTVWLSDLPLSGQLDPVVGLSVAAGCTTKLKLGANVVPIGRNPYALAKELAQLDQVSGGRLLLSFVTGIGQPEEAAVLGISGANRGLLLEEITPLVRAWWAGDTVDYHSDRFSFPSVRSPGTPVQDPLEVWFGGSGPKALARTGRLADGWLGSALTPAEAGDARGKIEAAAAEAGRAIDSDHFGLSIPYSVSELSPEVLVRLRGRRPDADPADLAPVGPDHLRELVRRYVDAGITKFVVRPNETRPAAPSGDVMAELADLLLPLQT